VTDKEQKKREKSLLWRFRIHLDLRQSQAHSVRLCYLLKKEIKREMYLKDGNETEKEGEKRRGE
jgi:hypothetical protein